MGWLIAVAGALWIALIMWDAFEAIVLPRRVTRRLRPTRMFYRTTWWVWSGLVAAFAMMQVGLGTRLNVEGGGRFADFLYLSGETFFTLGLGDIAPLTGPGRMVMVVEAGMGFGFLALIIVMPLPSWRVGATRHENWRTSGWGGAPGVPRDPHETD